MSKKWTKRDFDEAVQVIIEAFGDEGFDLSISEAQRDGTRGWKVDVYLKIDGPFGLTLDLDGFARLNYSANNITILLTPVNSLYPRLYAEYQGGKTSIAAEKWNNLVWE